MDKNKITILVADKNDSMLTAIQRELRRCGYNKIISAKDGKDVWSLLNDYDVSLAIVDIALDDISGLEILQRAKNSEELFAIPFLLTAVASDIKKIALAAKLDIGGILLKPFSQNTLMQKVESILNANTLGKETTTTSMQHREQTRNYQQSGIDIERKHDKEHVNEPTLSTKYQHLKVLVVEDSSTMLHVLKEWLGKLGFVNIVTATNGEEAWKIYKNEDDIDLIVSDWKMPEMTGIELLDKIREENKSPEIPFLLVTSETSTDSILDAGRHRVTGYISKPCNFINLSHAISKLYKQK